MRITVCPRYRPCSGTVAGCAGTLQLQTIQPPATQVTAATPDPRHTLTLPPLGLTELAEGTQRVAVTGDAAVWVGQVPITKLAALTRKTCVEGMGEKKGQYVRFF